MVHQGNDHNPSKKCSGDAAATNISRSPTPFVLGQCEMRCSSCWADSVSCDRFVMHQKSNTGVTQDENESGEAVLLGRRKKFGGESCYDGIGVCRCWIE